MKGIVLVDKLTSPYPCIELEINEFIKQSKSVPVLYNKQSFNEMKEIIDKGEVKYIIAWYIEPILLNIQPLYELGVPVIMFSGNCWNRLFDNIFRNIVKRHKPTAIVMENNCTRKAFKDYLGNDDMHYLWLPFSVDMNVMKAYDEKKEWDITITGKFSNYSDRREFHMMLTRRAHLIGVKYRRLRGLPTQEDYARGLNKSWMSLSSVQNEDRLYYKDWYIGSTYPKNFEIPACASALICRRWGDADELGFIDGENCILYENPKEFIQKLIMYKNDKDKLVNITEKGYALVHKEHTVQKHIGDLINGIKDII